MAAGDGSTPDFLRDVASFYTLHALFIGLRTGLIDAVLAGAATVDEICARAGVDRVHARNWLALLTAAGYLSQRDSVYTVVDEAVDVLRGSTELFDSRAVIEQAGEFCALLPVVIEALRSDGRVPPGTYGGAFGAASARVNTPMYRQSLVEWLASDARLAAELESGVTLVDLGCGDGSAVATMAAAFPNSSFVGVDNNPGAVEIARSACTEANATFETAAPERCDVVTVLDAFHHFADGHATLRGLRSTLSNSGTLVIAEPIYSGDIAEDTASPYHALGWAAALLYCDQEGRQPGHDDPISCLDGGAELRAALFAAGFPELSTFDTPNGYRFYLAR